MKFLAASNPLPTSRSATLLTRAWRLAPVTTEEIGSHPLDSGSHLDSSRVLRTGKIL
jgi:hypothetical protein